MLLSTETNKAKLKWAIGRYCVQYGPVAIV